jgi:hypothetical protein
MSSTSARCLSKGSQSFTIFQTKCARALNNQELCNQTRRNGCRNWSHFSYSQCGNFCHSRCDSTPERSDLYKPLAKDLVAVYLAETDSYTDKLGSIASVATVVLELAQEFAVEFSGETGTRTHNGSRPCCARDLHTGCRRIRTKIASPCR